LRNPRRNTANPSHFPKVSPRQRLFKRFCCRFYRELAILKALKHESALVYCRSCALRPHTGAVGAVGVGQAHARNFMQAGSPAVPLDQREFAQQLKSHPAGRGLPKSPHPRPPAPPHSWQKDQSAGRRSTRSPSLRRDADPRARRHIRHHQSERPQSVPRSTLSHLAHRTPLIAARHLLSRCCSYFIKQADTVGTHLCKESASCKGHQRTIESTA